MSIFDELNNLSNSPFDVNNNNSIFSFINDSPLGNWQREGVYDGLINFKSLFNFLIQGIKNNDLTVLFDYEKFISTSKVQVSALEQQRLYPTKDFLTFKDKEFSVKVPYVLEKDNGETISIAPKTILNKKLGKVSTILNFRTIASFKDEEVYYEIGFRYESDTLKYQIATKDYAILIRCKFYDQFEAILKILNFEPINESSVVEQLTEVFNDAFQNAGENPNNLDWIYEKAPDFIIAAKAIKQLLKDLDLILNNLVDEIGVNEELVVLKILKALAVQFVKQEKSANQIGNGADLLLKTLVTKKVRSLTGSQTMFERLYDKMNDKGFGENNFQKLNKFIYSIWYLSSWANQSRHTNDNETGPESLAYTNKKVLGFNSNDYDFAFKNVKDEGLKILVTKTEKTGQSFKDGSATIVTKVVGLYNPFQPLRMPEIPKEGEFELNNSIIPAFYLKAFDDKAAWSNFEKGSWLALDIISTFTGVGNILKFRHLLKLTLLKKTSFLFKLKIGTSLVEISSGTLSIILTLSENDSELGRALQKYLFILELASLSADVIIEKLLRKQAKETIEIISNLKKSRKNNSKNDLNEIEKHLIEFDFLSKWDNLPVSGLGFLKGKTLRRKEIKIWLNKINFISNGNSKLIILAKGDPILRGNKAGFNPFNGNIYVQKGLTEYEIFHEFKHLEEYIILGKDEYIKGMKILGGSIKQDLIRTYKREIYVFNEIIKNQKTFDPNQIKHANDIINNLILKGNNAGIDLTKVAQ